MSSSLIILTYAILLGISCLVERLSRAWLRYRQRLDIEIVSREEVERWLEERNCNEDLDTQ